MALLAACASGPQARREGAAASTTAAVASAAAVQPSPIRQVTAEELAEAQQQSTQALASRPEHSMPAAEQGYYLDVLQAALQRVRDDRFVVRREGDQVQIALGGPTFESGSAALTADAQARLSAIAAVLEEYAASLVVVHGHTDSSGNEALNLALSQRRADAVARYLLRQGVVAARLLAVGHGSSRPVADNATPEGQQANRRIELEVRPVRRASG
jgi:outer membrane protein OmpA-like peptidoglycan-associated protein